MTDLERARRIIGYTTCPKCSSSSLGIQGNGRLVRHSIGFGYVEKVGPGTRWPLLKTTICEGSGYYDEHARAFLKGKGKGRR